MTADDGRCGLATPLIVIQLRTPLMKLKFERRHFSSKKKRSRKKLKTLGPGEVENRELEQNYAMNLQNSMTHPIYDIYGSSSKIIVHCVRVCIDCYTD